MNTLKQKIGTSIFIENSDKISYPSVTICEYSVTGNPIMVHADGKIFESVNAYLDWKSGAENVPTNYTAPHSPDLKGMLYKLSFINSTSMSRLELGPDDIEDRESHLSSYYRLTHQVEPNLTLTS